MLVSVGSVTRTAIIGGVVAIAAIVLPAAWTVGSSEIADVELRDDMQDIASQIATRTGFSSTKSDEDLRNAVLKKAEKYDIALNPDQITVQQTGSGNSLTVYVAADYSVPVHVPGFEFKLHFTPVGQFQ